MYVSKVASTKPNRRETRDKGQQLEIVNGTFVASGKCCQVGAGRRFGNTYISYDLELESGVSNQQTYLEVLQIIDITKQESRAFEQYMTHFRAQ